MSTDEKKNKAGAPISLFLPQEAPEFEGTSVDLGEDLVQSDSSRATVMPREDADDSSAPQPEPEDNLQKGEILMSEGLLDAAKRVFWRLLRDEGSSALARQKLDEIQEKEMHGLLSSISERHNYLKQDEADDSPESVVASFEKDLGIDLSRGSSTVVPGLFPDTRSLNAYGDRIVKMAIQLPPRDRIDIGVAYLEMGLFEVAQKIFESVVRYEDHKVAGFYLLGLALIHGGKAVEATIRLEPLVRDTSLSESDKTDFLYLMGMAFEELKDLPRARDFYRRVHTLNSRYRNITEKLR